MTESSDMFRTVMRGYDPAEVNQRVDELTASVAALTQQRDGLASRVEELATATPSTEPPGYEHLGARVGEILSLADSEASELRARAQQEADGHRATAHQETGQLREETDRYSATTRSEADAQAARIVEDAKKAADEHRDSAERDARVRLQQAEAVYEEQRARAAKSAADFETTLAGRRGAAEDEFTQKMSESQARLDEANAFGEQTRTEAEAMRAQAAKEAGRLAEEAREQAAQIVGEAKTTAERIRADTERELAAATQRRDSINSQLANVRQMLATLTGTAPFSLTGFADAPDEAWDAHQGETGATEGADQPADEATEPVAAQDEHETDDGADDREVSEESLAHGRS